MDVKSIKHVHLGSVLIGIGRKWGHVQSTIPNEQEVFNFCPLQLNLASAILILLLRMEQARTFCAKFLTSHVQEREKLIVATKFGEQGIQKQMKGL